MPRAVTFVLAASAAIALLAGCVAIVQPPPQQRYPTDLQLRPSTDDDVIEASSSLPIRLADLT